MNKFAEQLETFFAEIEYEDALRIRDFIKEGRMETLINKKVKELENKVKVCPTCSTLLEREKSIVVQFGPKDFRKEARFCGIDCLEYFLKNMKNVISFS
ncbi:MAG: hypothetical protein V1659_00505 [Candidatus Woesearchaeota archaeon]